MTFDPETYTQRRSLYSQVDELKVDELSADDLMAGHSENELCPTYFQLGL